ncbi:MAG: hypothetical protein AB1798_23590, partial [Spirochaetota bacterium]
DGSMPLDEIVEIDPQNGKSRVIGHLSSAREFVTSVSFSGRLYLFGGSDARGQYLDEVLEIDPKTAAVMRRGHLPAERTRSCAAVVNNRIIAIGGWNGKKLNDVISIDPLSDDKESGLIVQILTNLDQGFSDSALVALDNKLYLIGGEDEQFQRQLRVLKIDPASWKTETLKFRGFLFW